MVVDDEDEVHNIDALQEYGVQQGDIKKLKAASYFFVKDLLHTPVRDLLKIKGISEDFPGAYSGQGRSWELKTKEAIELLPDKYGFQPKVVLSARAPPTITATAVPFSATRADYVPRQTHVFHE